MIRRVGRSSLLVVALGLLGLLLSSCQVGASFQYVSHRAADGVDLYFKVPPRWAIFNTDQVVEAQNGKLGPTQLKQIANGEWVETMSPRPGVTPKTSLGIGKRYPTAVVETRQLGESERDDLNFSAMRSELLGSDPLTATSGFQVLNYSEFALARGNPRNQDDRQHHGDEPRAHFWTGHCGGRQHELHLCRRRGLPGQLLGR